MSRAYRIAIKESLHKVLKAQDHVSTQLEILEVLPAEQMAELLAAELERRGFQRSNGQLVRTEQGIIVSVDPATAKVTVQAAAQSKVQLQVEGQAILDRDGLTAVNAAAKESARQELRKGLERTATTQQQQLQQQVTEKLEASLGDLRKELDQAINRVTAEALKKKAAQMGQIKEMTEDPQSGSLTIVVEV